MKIHFHRATQTRKRAVVAVFVMVMAVMLVGFAVITVDVGAMYGTKADLQRTADAASLAAAEAYFLAINEGNTSAVAINAATSIASQNHVFGMGNGFAIDPSDIQFGRFNLGNDTFVSGAVPFNAARIITRRDGETNGSLNLFFAPIFGISDVELHAEAVAMIGDAIGVADGVPIGIRAPGFGPIDPDIADANPGKEGPSSPINGTDFQIGEEVTVFIFGKGKKSPVHLILNTNGIPGEANLGKVMNGELPGIPLDVGDEFPVLGEGTGHNGLGGKLADRLNDGDVSNDIIIVPVLEEIIEWHGNFSNEITTAQRSRNELGELDGHVRIIAFVAIHLDAIVEETIPDPNDPQDSGKTIDIELLRGTIVQSRTTGSSGQGSGVVNGTSVGTLQLVR